MVSIITIATTISDSTYGMASASIYSNTSVASGSTGPSLSYRTMSSQQSGFTNDAFSKAKQEYQKRRLADEERMAQKFKREAENKAAQSREEALEAIRKTEARSTERWSGKIRT
jgi:hypothetical protein